MLVNEANSVALALSAARDVVGSNRVSADQEPYMGSEDFAEFLLEKPGAYIFLGNGLESRGGCMIHNPGYDFNDDNLPIGAQYWTALVQNYLA